MRTNLLLAAASLTAVPAAASSASCCAYGGNGAAEIMGVGTALLPTTTISNFLPVMFGATGPSKNPFVGVLLAPVTGPEDSLAGWMIMPNRTTGGQTLVAWTNLEGQTPQCFRGYTQPGESFTPGYSMCFGSSIPGAMFPFANGSYPLPGVGLPVTMYNQADGSGADVRARISVADQNCSPVFLASINTPFDTGAFSVSVEVGAATAPNWGLPTWC